MLIVGATMSLFITTFQGHQKPRLKFRQLKTTQTARMQQLTGAETLACENAKKGFAYVMLVVKNV